MPLYLSEADVASLLEAADAVDLVEASFRRLAAGSVAFVPRERLPIGDGYLAVMPAVDGELGVAGLKAYAVAGGGATFAVLLFATEDGSHW